MSFIPIENNFQFVHNSNTTGVIRAYLVAIGELAHALHYTRAEYCPKTREIVFVKGAVHSDPLPADDSQMLNVIYRLLWFEQQAQRSDLSGQMAERLQEYDRRIKALEERAQAFDSQPSPTGSSTSITDLTTADEDSAPAVPGIGTTLVPLEGGPLQRDEVGDIADVDPVGTLRRLREQASNIDGFLILQGDLAYYSRPRSLKRNTALDQHQRNDGLRYIFAIPSEMKAMQAFIGHDQELIAQQCLQTEAAS